MFPFLQLETDCTLDINQARAIMGMNEFTDIEELQVVYDGILHTAIRSGDLKHAREGSQALAEMLVHSGRMTRESADQFVSNMATFIASRGALLDQALAEMRTIDKRRMLLIGEQSRAEGALTVAEASVEESRARLDEAQETFRQAGAAYLEDLALRKASTQAFIAKINPFKRRK